MARLARFGVPPALVASVVALVACQANVEPATWRERFGYSPEAVHAIEVRELGYPFVEVSMAGETLWLPFDTGNMAGLTLETSVFRRLALPCDREWQRLDSGGRPVSTGCVANDVDVSVFGTIRESQSAREFSSDLIPGLVGPGMLPGDRFTIDYQGRSIAIDEGDGPEEVAGFASLPLVRSPRHPRLILVQGEVGDQDVLIEIDTGKSRTTIDERLVERLGLEQGPRGARVGPVVLGPRTAVIGWAREVDTSGISEGLPAPILLGIGSDTLSTFVWTVDYSAGLFWMELPSP